MPVPYTPLERQQLSYLQQFVGANPDVAQQVAPMFFGTLEGAQDRFDTNRAARQQGISGLRELAMQLAAGGASEDAVTAAVTGQAEQLPLMGDRFGGERRIGGLTDYVGELYADGPVSGLAPLDVRAQYGAGIDEQLRLEVAQEVSEQSAKGVPFTDIMDIIERGAIARGIDESTTEALRGEAQSIYERLIGSSLGEMRDTGAELRAGFGNTLTPQNLSAMGMPEAGFMPEGGMGVQSFLAQAANDPELYGALQGWEAPAPHEEPSLLRRIFG